MASKLNAHRLILASAAVILVLLLAANALRPAPRAQGTLDFTPTVTMFLPAVMRQYEPPTPTATRFAVCTPPPCDFAGGEVYYCPDSCPGGCGTLCATVTPEPGPCECHADLYNCADFSIQAAAQTCFDHCWDLGHGDIHRLDYDNNMIPCESLP